MHKIGAHVVGGPRDGWGEIAKQLVAVCSVDEPGAFDELDPRCIKIYRTQQLQSHIDAPGDFDKLVAEYGDAQDVWDEVARYWYEEGGFKQLLEPIFAKYENVYFQPTNEINNRYITYYMRGWMKVAEKHGFKLALFGDASGSPDWDDWVTYWVPVLEEAATQGHIYSRHAYTGLAGDIEEMVDAGLISDGLVRVLDESTELEDTGVTTPIVVSELGWRGGHSDPPATWLVDLVGFNDHLISYPFPNIAALCLWTWGHWPHAQSGDPNLSGSYTQQLKREILDKHQPAYYTEPVANPPAGNIAEHLREAAAPHHILVPHFGAFYKYATALGYTVASREIDTEFDGETYRFMTAQRDDYGDEIIVYAKVGDWGNVAHIPIHPPKKDDGKTDPKDTPFKFTHWPTPHKVINQVFGNNPDYYGQWGLPGHEGVDIRAFHGDPIWAVADGEVYEVKPDDGHNYGVRVRVRHSNGYRSVYAHLDRTFVQVGQRVTGGEILGLADSTGNSSGPHLHFTLKLDGATAAGVTEYPADIIDPTPFLTTNLPLGEPYKPAPVNTLDIAEYMFPLSANGRRMHTIRNNTGGGEKVYTFSPAPGWWVQQKNNKAEIYYLDDEYIYLVADTSPGGDRYYKVFDIPNVRGMAPYAKRQTSVGQSWSAGRDHWVQFYNWDGSESEANSGVWAGGNVNAVLEHFDKWMTVEGIELDDVITLGAPGGHEYHIYARGRGRIGWHWDREKGGIRTVWYSEISEIIDDSQQPDPLDWPPNYRPFG